MTGHISFREQLSASSFGLVSILLPCLFLQWLSDIPSVFILGAVLFANIGGYALAVTAYPTQQEPAAPDTPDPTEEFD